MAEIGGRHRHGAALGRVHEGGAEGFPDEEVEEDAHADGGRHEHERGAEEERDDRPLVEEVLEAAEVGRNVEVRRVDLDGRVVEADLGGPVEVQLWKERRLLLLL